MVLLATLVTADFRDSVVIHTKESYYSNKTTSYKHAVLVYYADGQIYRFPDKATYEIVLHDLNNKQSVFSEHVAKQLLKLEDMHSKPLLPSVLNHHKLHEDSLHLRLTRSFILEKSTFIDEKSLVYLEDKVNPSVVYFNNKMLIVYSDKGKVGMVSKCRICTTFTNTLHTLTHIRILIHIHRYIHIHIYIQQVAFGWYNPLTGGIDDSMELWGLGGSHKHPVVYSKQQEDPRLLKLSDHSILLTFSATQVWVYVWVCMYMYMNVCLCMCVCVFMYVRMYVYGCERKCIYSKAYIYKVLILYVYVF
ncbi:hypothetical protein EON63_18420 [archaeon]|nr:MAG: hypothetical protein EON63_18420 [archaeon]